MKKLSELEKDAEGVIASINGDQRFISRVTSIGLTPGRTKDTFIRALKVVVVVALAFWLLSYTSTGDITNSILYKIGHFIEPVTKIFGMGWQTFMAFIASSTSSTK